MHFVRSLVVLVLLSGVAAHASDLAKEKLWKPQVVDALVDGEPVELDDGRALFFAIETESATDASDTAVIIMHGTGVHPNWPTVVLPLRVGLTESGLHTLSIQMPVLANEAEHAAYAASMTGCRDASKPRWITSSRRVTRRLCCSRTARGQR